MEITLTIDKSAVMEEVAQTTAYTGAKMVTDNVEVTMRRVSTVDEDEKQLERFWNESRSEVCQELIGLVSAERESGDKYLLELSVSNSFDMTLLESMEISLNSYFVQNIAAKWYVYSNKGEAGAYADKAHTLLEDVHRKAVYKRKPRRPTY